MKIVEARPMKVPSIVLPLLIEGIIFLLPNNLPPKYAKMSIVLTKITAYKIVYNPLENCKITIREKKETIIKHLILKKQHRRPIICALSMNF